MGIAETVHESVSQHGRIGTQPWGSVWGSKVSLRGQFPECHCVGTNRLSWKLVPTQEQRVAEDFGQVQVEVSRQGSHEFVV